MWKFPHQISVVSVQTSDTNAAECELEVYCRTFQICSKFNLKATSYYMFCCPHRKKSNGNRIEFSLMLFHIFIS